MIPSQQSIFVSFCIFAFCECRSTLTFLSTKHLTKMKRHASEVERRPICFMTEPCSYSVVRRSNTPNTRARLQVIPTWCKCSDDEECRIHDFDDQLKANTYRCAAIVNSEADNDR